MLVPAIALVPYDTAIEYITPSDLKALAAPHIREIACELCNNPNLKKSSQQELRFGSNGSLSIHLGETKIGQWHDHETGEGGSIIDLVARQTGSNFSGACYWLIARLGYRDAIPNADELERRRAESAALMVVHQAEKAAIVAKKQALALKIWNASIPPAGTPVETYLRGRACWQSWLTDGRAIRFNPAFPMDYGGNYPALVAAMTDVENAECTGVHRTHLQQGGLGKGVRGKKMLGPAKNAIVRLRDEPGTTATIAEGIENALSTSALLGIATPIVAACLSAGNMRTMPLLRGVTNTHVVADVLDNDVGIEAACHYAARCHMAERMWTIFTPPPPYEDANDAVSHLLQLPGHSVDESQPETDQIRRQVYE